MNKYKRPEVDEAKLGTNPFLSGLEIKINKVKTGDKFRNDDGIWTKADVEFESAPFCKLFTDSERRLDMVKLSPRAKDLYLWLVYEVNTNKDWLWLNKVRYMEENAITSINTYRAAVNELISACFIVKAVVSDVYWINPHYFFAGNRITKFPNNVKIK